MRQSVAPMRYPVAAAGGLAMGPVRYVGAISASGRLCSMLAGLSLAQVFLQGYWLALADSVR